MLLASLFPRLTFVSSQRGFTVALHHDQNQFSRSWSALFTRTLQTSTHKRGYVQSWEDVAEDQIEPYSLVRDEVSIVGERIRHSISNTVMSLSQAAEYFFRQGAEGKRLRPTILLLMASALSPVVPAPHCLEVDLRPPQEHISDVRRRQQRIAEVAEMIHVASLLHDDVLDDASTRRGMLSLNAKSGNKLAILAGDYLLARASVSLAALQNTEVVQLLSQVLEHLVTGEIMQMNATQAQLLDLQHYLDKSFCKTASLMANSCRAIAVLGGHPSQVCDLAWAYGRHLGLAFQVVDDVLDMTSPASVLGKPALNDLKSGLATAPVLFAAQEFPALEPLILRHFRRDGDVALALSLVQRSGGIQRAQELAAQHAVAAADMVRQLPPALSEHADICRQALVKMADKVLTRCK